MKTVGMFVWTIQDAVGVAFALICLVAVGAIWISNEIARFKSRRRRAALLAALAEEPTGRGEGNNAAL